MYAEQAYILTFLVSAPIPDMARTTFKDSDERVTRKKDERLAVRLSPTAKETLEHAAELSGRSLTDFVVGSALECAHRTIEENERMRLAKDDRAVFVSALLGPPEPNSALKKAAARYKQRSA